MPERATRVWSGRRIGLGWMIMCWAGLLGAACDEGGAGGPGIEPALVSLPQDLRDRVELVLSFRTQDNSAPIELELDGTPGALFVPLTLDGGSVRLEHDVQVPVGRHRAAVDFYLPWSAYAADPDLASCEPMPACAYDAEGLLGDLPGCAPACLHREFAHGQGERLLLMRLTGGVTIRAGAKLSFSDIGFDVPALDAYDEDGDGLSNLEEVSSAGDNAMITNPCRADTDGDAVRDGFELQLGADPVVCDVSAPTIEAVTVNLPQDRDDGFVNLEDRDQQRQIMIALQVDKPLAEADGYPEVKIGEYAATCVRQTADDPLAFDCTYTLTGQETDGARVVVVVVADPYGHFAQNTDQQIAFDFTPPQVAGVALTYLPGSDNPLDAPTAATAGTTIMLTVLAQEPLAVEDYPPALELDCGGTALDFGSATTASAGGAVFAQVLPAGFSDGPCTPSVRWMDLAGNVHQGSFAQPVVELKTSAPALQVRQDRVLFLRSPWGHGQAVDLGGFTIPAGPYFALAPTAPGSPDPVLPADTFGFAAGTPAMVRVWADDTGLGAPRGEMRAEADGTWPRISLTDADVPFVYVTGVDRAGNEDAAPVRIQTTEWIATPNDQGSGGSPHVLTSSTRAAPQPMEQVVDGLDRIAEAGPEVQSVDGQAAVRSAGLSWRERIPDGAGPSTRTSPAFVFDVARGRAVLFGGAQPAGTNVTLYRQDTWEWDGQRWSDRAPQGALPGGRSGAAAAYDSARGRVVLFGGARTFYDEVYGDHVLERYDDLWEWNGSRWQEMLPEGDAPRERTSATMAFDSARGELLLFGGVSYNPVLNDTWIWDGGAWQEVPQTGAWPPVRSQASMAYDAARDKIVLFGGFDDLNCPTWLPCPDAVRGDTWEWDGATRTWQDVTPAAGNPPDRLGHRLVYDAGRGVVILYGGQGEDGDFLDDAWAWDGVAGAWLPLDQGLTLPHSRAYPGLAYDPGRDRLLLCFGVGLEAGLGHYPRDLWSLDDGGWRELTPTDALPPLRTGMAMAYDPLRERTVVFGGRTPDGAFVNDTWEWDGQRWEAITPLGDPPSARQAAAMAFDPALGVLILFGGYRETGGVAADTWAFDGADWVELFPPANIPNARASHGMVLDEAHGQIVLFGGFSASYYQDTWLWDGVTGAWTNATPASNNPATRMTPALAWDPLHSEVVLFGGGRGSSWVAEDTWTWDGATWHDRNPVTAPPARRSCAMAFDEQSGRVIVQGGVDTVGAMADVWAWDGTDWQDITPAVRPAERSGHQMVYHDRDGQLFLWGDAYGSEQNTYPWQGELRADRQPAFDFAVDFSRAGLADGAAAVTSVQVQAHAGGESHPAGASSPGAALYAWRGWGQLSGWTALATNAMGLAASQPTLPDQAGALIDWTSADATEADQILLARDGQIFFQIRPIDTAAGDPESRDPQVALDAIEVRVRYQAP